MVSAWRCSGCAADPTCSGTCPKCDSICLHGSCKDDQCYCDSGYVNNGGVPGVGHECSACAEGFTGYPNCSRNWTPRYNATGIYTNKLWKPAESTPFRFKGEMYVMESVEGNGGFFSKEEGGSYFRITKLSSGAILRNVSESIGHAFFSAVVDDKLGVVWVFGAAHHRGWDNNGPCDDNSKTGGMPAKGCYVGAWKSTDLINWSKTYKTVIFPDGNYTQNNDVTLVRPAYSNWNAHHGNKLPKHQAAMALEAEGGKFAIAINIGHDGDLSRTTDWQILWNVQHTPEHACPALRYDEVEGYYYLTGGGETQEGPYRSKNLLDWEKSPFSPLTQNSVTLAAEGLQALADRDSKIGPFYTQRWKTLSSTEMYNIEAFFPNVSNWSWGHSDFDWCCDDNQAPSYLLYMVTQQGKPANWTGRGSWYQAMGSVNLPILEWLRSYFPSKPSRQWTKQTNMQYVSEKSANNSGTRVLGIANSSISCENMCNNLATCHAYTWNSPSSKDKDSKCIGRTDGHYVPTPAQGYFSGHDSEATPILPPGPPGPRPVSPSPPFIAGECGAVKQPCTSDADCPTGCSQCRCFNANGASVGKTSTTECPLSYGGNIKQGFCSNDTAVHLPDCWEHPCGQCGGPPFPIQEWAEGKKQYLMIGDSVSLKMWNAVNNSLLNSTSNIAPFHIPINGGPTDKGVQCISEWLGTNLSRWDVITYNFGMWNIGPDDCSLAQTKYGRYIDSALETYIWGLANITATLTNTRAGKEGHVFFVNTNPTADVKECCTHWPHIGKSAYITEFHLGTHSCFQRTSIYNQAAAKLLRTYNVSIIDIYGWAVRRCGDPRGWNYGCDIIPQPNCTSPQGECRDGVCHDKQAYCNLTDHSCYNGTNCGACQVHPSSKSGPSGFMSGSDYLSIPVTLAVKSAVNGHVQKGFFDV